ncbi:hypothetical protein EZV62_024326 [Acer yangbiense]|uniref:NIF system FeS cluster assembly NifU C-terminal domain-containing protein n=1 Tax=Acer yangbiense TaxID=1000413 RepID=A0A5C7H5V5_9ROSI|nr:hypothetical protein EZV62_024326 [Acer yangbiense]
MATPDSAVELPLTAKNVENVMEEVRPYLIADGGNVALHEIDGNIVRLKLQGLGSRVSKFWIVSSSNSSISYLCNSTVNAISFYGKLKQSWKRALYHFAESRMIFKGDRCVISRTGLVALVQASGTQSSVLAEAGYKTIVGIYLDVVMTYRLIAVNLAQQKMLGSVQSTYSGYQKASDREIGYSLKKSLVQDNYTASSEVRTFNTLTSLGLYPYFDFEISSFNSRNSDKRCAVLTLFEPVRCRIVALPLQCIDQSIQLGSGVPVNMESLQLVSPSSINSFKVDRLKAQKGPPHDVTYSVKSFTRPFPGSDVRYQSRNRTLTNKVTRLNKFPINSSSHSYITYSNSSDVIPQRSNPFKSCVIVNENSNVDKGVKRNSRKKARKKGKQNKKLSPDTVFTEPEVFSEDYTHGSSTSLSSGNNDIVHSDGLVSYATSQDDSLLESRVNTMSSESPQTSTSCTDEVDASEAKEPSRVQNFPGEPPVINSEIGIKMEDQRFSITDGGLVETLNLHSSYFNGIHLNGFSDIYDSQVLDSVSVGSSSDISISTSCDAKPCDRASNKISLSEAPGFSSRKGKFSPPNPYSGDVDFCDYTEGSGHGNQGFNSTEVQVVAPSKRGKQAKMVPRGSSAYRLGTAGNLHGRTGKENNHSVWQRVQKKDVGQSNSELKKESPVVSQPHVTLKEASLHRRNPNIAEVNMLSKAEDNERLKNKVSRKSKRKTSPGSKKEYNSYSRKGLYSSKASSNVRTEIGIQHNEMLDISKQVNGQKRLSSVSRSCSRIGCPDFGIHSSNIESLSSESFHSSKDGKNNVASHESICSTISGMEKQNQDNSLAKSCCSLDKLNPHEVRSPVYLPHLLFNKNSLREKDALVTECSKQNQSSASFSQKWIPIGTRDPRNTTSARCGNSSLGQSDRQGAEDWTLRNNIDERAASHSQDLVASLNVRMRSMAPISEIITSKEDEKENQKLWNIDDKFHETSDKHVTANGLTNESKDINLSIVETDSNKIVRAVKDGYRVQLASEAVRMATGSPIAEFERLLHFSSPVICHLRNLIRCKNCSLDQVDSSLCRHETLNISLGCLWQWYEKHGSIGLEIRAEDFERTKRLGVDRFSFRAYFVPLLSAIQLFKNSKSRSIKNSNRVSTPGVSEVSKTGETLKSSTNDGHLPIFSLLVPQPRTSVSAKEDLSVPSVDMTFSNDPELLFEYFESEQPRQRRPLYEKYSVAWYPIYRIPDGNFRAAFLTYHSLGHMIRRVAKVDSASTEAFVVSPVVGLQSYNAQSECWFQLSPSAVSQASENPNLNPSGILKERLRTLEKTASLMARAVVNKGDHKSVNRHPDYEFFLSR